MRKATQKLIDSGILEAKGLEFVREGDKGRVILGDAFGEMDVATGHILKGTTPSVQAACDKNAYTAAKFRSVHGDKYDYSKVEYQGNKTKVEIICPTHGSFWQIPDGHLRGQGCPTCGGTTKSNTEEFIVKARVVHGDKYNYSKVEYQGNKTKVEIICPTHGSFMQTPGSHLRGIGCAACGGSKKNSTADFTKKARAVHGDNYNYNKVEYQGSKTKVEIICPTHGSFMQTPDGHLRGNGCPECANVIKAQKYFKDTPTTLYVIQFTPDVVKVGITTRTIAERFKHEKTKPKVLYEVHFEDGLAAFIHEQMLLDQTATYKATPEQTTGILYHDGGITELRSIKAMPKIKGYICKNI